MRLIANKSFASLLFLVACSNVVRAQDAATYSVGVARVNVTPDYPIRLNGFGGRREESEGVSQRIYARALAVARGDSKPVVIVAVDSLGVRIGMADEVAGRLHERFGIPRANVAITFTHSHCTPKVNGASDNIFSQPIPPTHQEHIDRYTRELTNGIEHAASVAIRNGKPARLVWGVGKVGFAMNRRTKDGPVDHDLPVLVARNVDDDGIQAIYASYACHCVTLSFNQISGDWGGYAAEMIERTNPGAIALVSIGCGSDANPSSGVTGNKIDVAELQGTEIATEVARLMKSELSTVKGQPSATLNSIPLRLNELPSKEQFELLADQGGPAGYNATTQLAKLERGEALLTAIDYPIQTFSFGDDLSMVFLAGEVCVDYSLRLKRELHRDRVWLNAYSNDFCSYIPSERLVREGGYGGGAEIPYFALPTTLKAGLEQRIVDEVKRQVPRSVLASEGTHGIPPKSPDDSLHCMQTHDDLRIELVASEPFVVDPVAIDFGPDGRLWVAEMNDYGHDVYESFKPTGRVRWLRDVDGNGQFDHAQTFVDGLRFPTDVKVLPDGVLICDAPDILLATDIDHDGKADSIQKLYTGFEVRNAQARVNSLRLGLDNWIHGSGGLFGGQITNTKTTDTIDLTDRDFRFHPVTREIEPVTGRAQQGRCRNDWGDWFGCTNGTLATHYAVDDRYHRRNPLVAPPPTSIDIATGENASKLIPAGELVKFELSGATGQPTSACGLEIYRDRRLGEEYFGNAFTCEPVHQLVHRLVLKPNGITFVGHRAEDEREREFVASTDQWFRPVQVRTGPDGAIWVVDMYRYVIEHGRWIPKSSLGDLDVFAGQGRGRIYRIVPRDESRNRSWPRLDTMNTTDLVNQLDHPNGTIRDLAQQIIVWQAGEQSTPLLKQLVRSANLPQGRLHALCTLDGLAALEADDVLVGLGADHPEVVRQAIRIAEGMLGDPRVVAAVAALARHPSPRVRQQVVYSLGETDDSQAAQVLAELAASAGDDMYLRAAVLSSIHENNVSTVFGTLAAANPTLNDFFSEVARLAVRLGDENVVASAFRYILARADQNETVRFKTLATVLDAADRRERVTLDDDIWRNIKRWQDEAQVCLFTGKQPDDVRVAALQLVARRDGDAARRVVDSGSNDNEAIDRRVCDLISLLEPVAVQRAAIEAMSQSLNAGAADLFLTQWNRVGPEMREEIIRALLSRPDWTGKLLTAAQNRIVSRSSFSATRRQQLLTHPSPEIRDLATTVFEENGSKDRTALVDKYAAALNGHVEATRGRELFRKSCSSCHRLDEYGFDVGPDLMALTNRDPLWLLTAILDPNRDVDARYTEWMAIDTDGRTVNGLLVEATSSAIRLKEANDKEHVVLRANLDQLRSTDRSMMPEGIERDLTPQDLADILAYITALKSPPQSDAMLPRGVGEIAALLLDASQPIDRKRAVIDRRPGLGPAIVSQIASAIGGDASEENKRIRAIWQVAIAVGRRNDGGELRDLLEVSLPQAGEPLREWQAVAVGGGIINGISQLGIWPDQRLAEVLSGVPSGVERWQYTMTLASEMSDSDKVRTGTRYDALRMIALEGWEQRGAQLMRYLTNGVHDELQMGAVSGLVDMQSADASDALLHQFSSLSPRNQKLAVEGMLRTEQRCLMLLNAINAGHVAKDAVEHQALVQHPSDKVKKHATRIFAE